MMTANDELDAVFTALAHETRRRILDALRDPVFVAGQECFVTASVGIAMFPRDGLNLVDLMRNSDVAMYAAKQHADGPRMYESAIDAGSAQTLKAAPGDRFEGINGRHHHAGNAGLDQGIGAGRRAPVVRARLQAHVSGRPAGCRPGRGQSKDFGVGKTGARVKPLAQHAIIERDHAADAGIGLAGVKTLGGEIKRALHVPLVGFGKHRLSPLPRRFRCP